MSQQNPLPSFVIAISGAAGSGKTTLARRVVDILDDAVAIHFDDYKPVAKYPTDMAKWVKEGKELNAWEIPQLLDDLKALRSGKTISLPAGQGKIGPAKFIVLEEPSGRIRAGMQELVDFVVLLELPLEIALARKVVQDLGRCLTEVPPDGLAKAVQKGVDYYALYPLAREYYLTLIESVKKDCDLILDGTRTTDELAQEIVATVKSIVSPIRVETYLPKPKRPSRSLDR